jgi:uncharacterized membrane protein
VNLRRSLLGATFLSVAGLLISLYLTWAYLIDVSPICGASGGCSTVQHSSFAWIAGVPVPLLGAVAYSGLIALGILALRWQGRRDLFILALFGGSLVGMLFSGYLTYLEFFVINALCKWCIASALVTVAVFVLATLAYRQHQAEA